MAARKEKLPRTLSEFTEVAEAERVVAEADARLDEVLSQEQELAAALDTDGADINAMATRVLAGEDVATLRVDAVELMGKLQNVRTDAKIRQEVVRVATERLDEIKTRVFREKVVPAIRTAYGERVNRLATALVELDAAVKSERELREGYNFGALKVFPVHASPAPIAYDASRAAYWAKEVVRDGYVTEDVVAPLLQ